MPTTSSVSSKYPALTYVTIATTGAERSRRSNTVSPFGRRFRTTDAGSIVNESGADNALWPRGNSAACRCNTGGRNGARLHSRLHRIRGGARGPRAGAGAVQEGRRFRRAAEPHQRATEISLRRLVGGIGLG